jgi:hypothetical protein
MRVAVAAVRLIVKRLELAALAAAGTVQLMRRRAPLALPILAAVVVVLGVLLLQVPLVALAGLAL